MPDTEKSLESTEKSESPAENISPENTDDSDALDDLRQIEDDTFSREMEMLIEQGEDMRLNRSRSYSMRRRIYHVTLALLVMGTASYFIWVLLMGGPLLFLGAAFIATVILPVMLQKWSMAPYKKYIKEYKTRFLPRLANQMGGLKFHPTGGISRKSILPAQILPPHKAYESEDCFIGKYEDVGILISEARLYKDKKKNAEVFDGVFVMLSAPKKLFKGHTIIMADQRLGKRWNTLRWKSLDEVETAVTVNTGDFVVFSDTPDEARQLADDDMMALLHKLSDLFNQSDVSVSFYNGNRVFMMIPYDEDMFEPGDIFIPVSNQKHALKCKREIEQFLNVIDILKVYEADENL